MKDYYVVFQQNGKPGAAVINAHPFDFLRMMRLAGTPLLLLWWTELESSPSAEWAGIPRVEVML
jgi:hypothetical protein